MNLVEFSTTRRVTVAMAALTLVLFGIIALRDLRVNLLPDLSYPTLTVRTTYTGAAPSEIESLITEPVEEAVGVVKGLRRLHSVSRTSQSDVILEFAWGSDMDQASLEVRDKLEVLQLPLEAKSPLLLRFNPSTEPVLRLALATAGDNRPGVGVEAELKRLRRYADEELKKRLEPIPGLAAVKVAGGFEDEIQVLIDQQRLAQLNLLIETVISRLSQENVNISGGRIEEGSQRYLVRTVNQFASVDEMRELFIGNVDGRAVRLRDIAAVEQGHRERDAVIRVGGDEAIELALYKEGDANTVEVADAVQAALGELREALPPGTRLDVIEDQSKFIRAALTEVRNEALLGGLLAVLVIFIFLRDGWSTFVIAISLPVSIIATFFFMGQLDLSLNVMSLAGLALATGMVVDDAIVVLEAVAKNRERGLGILEAAVAGTREVFGAVTASTLTTIAVFLPLVFVEGVAGQIFRDQALTVSIAIALSWVVAITLIPMLSSLGSGPAPALKDTASNPQDAKPVGRLRRVARGSGRVAGAVPGYGLFGIAWLVATIGRALRAVTAATLGRLAEWLMRRYDGLEGWYAARLATALRFPAIVLGVAGLAFVAAMFVATTLGTDLIPQFAQDRFLVTAKLPPGTRLAETDALMRQVQLKHRDDPSIQTIYGVAGSGARLDANPTDSGENIARMSVVLGEGYDREAEAATIESMRRGLADVEGLDVEFGRPELLGFSAPLSVELRGYDLDTLQTAGRELAARMREAGHFVDVRTSAERGYPEVQIRFDAERAAALGLTSRQIADQVVKKLRGEVATRYSLKDRKIDVLVRAREADRASVADISRLIVNPGAERPVTLDAVADIVQTVGPSEIHRADQTRAVIIESNLDGIDLGGAINSVEGLVAAAPLPAGVRLRIGGQGEELEQSMSSLIFAFGLAIFLVYLVMASQFESLLHPFVILFTVPLAMVGAVLALKLTGAPVSVVVFIGLILLVGIVVKNAIVLIDRVNQVRAAGLSKREALVAGARERLRPILMTTLTTLFGFMPLAIAGGEGSEVKAPMALTVIGGLTVSTLLTLIVIPVVYDLLDRRSDEAFRRASERRAALERFRSQAEPV